MKPIFAILIFFLASSALAKGIDPAHQICKVDSDCRIIIVGCGCIHNSTCLGPNDKAAGFVRSINKRFEKLYEELSKCSASELRQCSMTGACAAGGEWQPTCNHGKCDAVFKDKRI